MNRLKENTLESLAQIINLKDPNYRFGIEFDVQVLPNGEIICYHDNDLVRIHGHNRKIKDIEPEELEGLNIPTLVQILEALDRTPDVLIDIEVKIYDQSDIDIMVEQINRVLKKFNELKSQIIVTSFCEEFVNAMLETEFKLGFICYDSLKIQELVKKGVSHVVVHKDLFTKYRDDILEITRGPDKTVMIYTFFDSHETHSSDQQLLHTLSGYPKIGIITDDWTKIVYS